MIARALGYSIRPTQSYICTSCLCSLARVTSSQLGYRLHATAAAANQHDSGSAAPSDETAQVLSPEASIKPVTKKAGPKGSQNSTTKSDGAEPVKGKAKRKSRKPKVQQPRDEKDQQAGSKTRKGRKARKSSSKQSSGNDKAETANVKTRAARRVRTTASKPSSGNGKAEVVKGKPPKVRKVSVKPRKVRKVSVKTRKVRKVYASDPENYKSQRLSARGRGRIRAGGQQRNKRGSTGHSSIAGSAEELYPSFENAAGHKSLSDVFQGKKEAVSRSDSSVNETVNEITEKDLGMATLEFDQASAPLLSHGLDRVLFNPGVHYLQDPRSRIYNFDPYLEKIMPVTEFDFDALKEYMTSSKDDTLSNIAKEQRLKYVGSTSSMTGVLSHFHYLISQWRELNVDMLSKGFPETLKKFTKLQCGPVAVFLRLREDGVYAIDADHAFDSGNILLYLGKSMEKLLTLPKTEFERYRVSNPEPITEKERSLPETYHYSSFGDILMRAQIDARDPRLPGTGTFDLKTRAVVSIRMDVGEHQNAQGYQIRFAQGRWESYEREYYDMMRSTMLKYSLQVRMGNMDGIFVAYHNVERMFGFQYISLPEMDSALHGDSQLHLGDQEFKSSLKIFNIILNKITERFPGESVRLHVETRDASVPFMYIFAEPVSEHQIEDIQKSQTAKLEEYERSVLGLKRTSQPSTDDWTRMKTKVEEEIMEDELASEEEMIVNESAMKQPSLDHTPDGLSPSPAVAQPETNDISGSENPLQPVERSADDALYDSDATVRVEDKSDPKSDSRKDEQPVPEQAASRHTNTVWPEWVSRLFNGAVRFIDEDSTAGNVTKPSHHPEETVSEIDGIPTRQLETSNEDTDAGPPRRLMAFTLMTRNKVNGTYVKRPDQLTPGDQWTIEYSLTEISPPEKAERLYDACMRRRELQYNREDDTNDRPDYFRATIQEVVQRGKKWREQQDIIDDEKGQILYEPIASSAVPPKDVA